MKILTVTLFFLLIISAGNAQIINCTKQDSLYQELAIKLDVSGDYLIKASHNIRNGAIASLISSGLFIVSANAKRNIWKDSSCFFGSIAGVYSIYQFICVPINLNKSGKALKTKSKLNQQHVELLNMQHKSIP
ncbi:MAG: hypothetical protein BGO29_14810 [Bacteroidales bacterium 36-12]|nr:MAG: hypothetical protein BGO29_14810 [Bacteroidales bacterium 36-12]